MLKFIADLSSYGRLQPLITLSKKVSMYTLFTFALATLLSLISCVVLSYISMATPIGPWIAPTLVIVGSLIISPIMKWYRTDYFACAIAGGSIGGIIATACGFSFPTLYFLAPSTFLSWLHQPWYFFMIMGLLCLSAALFGYVVARMWEHSFLVEQQLAFPIGQLVYSMLTASGQRENQNFLLSGCAVASLLSIMQGGIRFIPTLIPTSIDIVPTIRMGIWHIQKISIRLDMLPMLLAIGFIAGHLITIPLLIGALSKLLVLDVVHAFFFSFLSASDFMLAFCSGMVLVGALSSFIELPAFIKYTVRMLRSWKLASTNSLSTFIKDIPLFELFLALALTMIFLHLMNFTLLQQLFLMGGALITTYQITLIAGKIGMAQLGRFATFVMIPFMILFGIDPVKVTITACFIEISGGVATDIMFGKKMGRLMGISESRLNYFQLWGIGVASMIIGFIFWLLISHFSLGSEQLFAQRAQARALLIHAQHVNVMVLLLGMLYGYLLKCIKINPLLVLGGLLMPLNYSISLMLGGLLSLMVANKTRWEPFWSGMFAANSLWELIKIIL